MATLFSDTFRTQGLRKKMITELRSKGIVDEKVLQAMEEVPRHFFSWDEIFVEKAYQNIAFQIGAGQTISQPYTVAFQTELLEVSRNSKVLEIGTGSGYQAAILTKMGAKVYSIERQKYLHEKTKKLFQMLKIPCTLVYGDGYKGFPQAAPYDRIVVTCGAPYVPDTLLEQLAIGGRMVIPVGEGETQTMVLLVRKDEKTFQRSEMGVFRFVPMLEDKNGGGF